MIKYFVFGDGKDVKITPIETLPELISLIGEHKIKLGKGVKLDTIWNKKWREYIGEAPD